MAGELNGTQVLIKRGTSTIVGQMECTLTFNGTPIDLSNKSHQDWVVLLSGELAGKQLQLAGTLVYNSDTTYKQTRADALTGTQAEYSIVYGDSGEAFTCQMVPTALSDALPMGDKVTTSLTFLSSGEVQHTAAS
jgi:predicted secreted protein